MQAKTLALTGLLALASITFVATPAAANCDNYGNQVNVGSSQNCTVNQNYCDGESGPAGSGAGAGAGAGAGSESGAEASASAGSSTECGNQCAGTSCSSGPDCGSTGVSPACAAAGGDDAPVLPDIGNHVIVAPTDPLVRDVEDAGGIEISDVPEVQVRTYAGGIHLT